MLHAKIIFEERKGWPYVRAEGPFEYAGSKLRLLNFATSFVKNLASMCKMQRIATDETIKTGATRMPTRFDAMCALAFCPDDLKPTMEEYFKKKGIMK